MIFVRYIFTSEERIEAAKKLIESDIKTRLAFKYLAESFMNTEPPSVTYHKSPAVSGNPHDYFSEGTYWWPDENNPGGPYIRRDGEVNPDNFGYHLNDLGTLSDAVCVLCQAGLLLGDKKYYDKAVSFIRTWFLDAETMMNPHLEYSQAIRGICDGRAIGIIDTVRFIKLIYGADILDKTGLYPGEISGLKSWFDKYIHWLNTSGKGVEEKNYFNNHANWWNTQVATYSAFVGNEELLSECFNRYLNIIIPNQTDENGVFTDEITRTLSYTYTMYNITACALICEIAHFRGIDLWNATAPNGNSLKKCVEFFKPYYENPFLWKYTQLKADGCFAESLPMKLAEIRYEDSELADINRKRREQSAPFSQISYIGMIDFI